MLDELCQLTDPLVRVALLAAGYRQHKPGEWRKRGTRKSPAPAEWKGNT